jgi:hypothetical protein
LPVTASVMAAGDKRRRRAWGYVFCECDESAEGSATCDLR